MSRVRRVIEACDRHVAAVILGCYYQRQDQVLTDEAAVRAGVLNAARWVAANGFTNKRRSPTGSPTGQLAPGASVRRNGLKLVHHLR
jgi:hypothetical protein